MESFELLIGEKTYKIIRVDTAKTTFSVFNHSSFHTIAKTNFYGWVVIEHRFGDHQIPLRKIGKGIDEYLAKGIEAHFNL